jgi:hypothetical protein
LLAETYFTLRRRLGEARFRSANHRIPEYFARTGSLFIHVPKAAGMSVTLSLYGREVGHRRFIDYERIDPEGIRSLFRFTVVRDPIARFVSAFFFLKKGGMAAYPADRQFAGWVLSRFEGINHFVDEWVSSRSIYCYHHFTPQVWYLRSLAGTLDLDLIAKVDTLNDDFVRIQERLGTQVSLSRANVNPHPDAYEALTETAVRKLRQIYADDFRLLRY